MEIIKHGTHPIDNIAECEECHCLFSYFRSEVNHECTTPYEEGIFGGFGSYDWLECPECKNKIIFNTQFTPYENSIDKFIKWFKLKFRRKSNADIK